jgi:predicted amidohydrolase YtcJ
VEVARDRHIKGQLSKHGEVVDAKGRTVLPGFIDAHAHVRAYAEKLMSLDLSPQEGICSIRMMQERIRQWAAERLPGTWIRGKGFHEFYFSEGRHPTRWDLDAAAPVNPVKLTHRSGHAHVLNSLALKEVGISAETGDPEGGIIDRDLRTGEPTGILYGMGGFLAGKIPSLSEAEIDAGVRLASQNLLSFGITSVQDASSYNDLESWKQFEAWKTTGLLKTRLTLMRGVRDLDLARAPFHSESVHETHLRAGGIKIIIHEVTGRLSPSQEELNEMILAIHRAGIQVILHAVEENTIEAACNAVEHALRYYPRRDHRHRIEHCALCPPFLLDRMSSLGIAVVTQPPFIYYSGDRYLQTVPPEKQDYLYRLGAMLGRGMIVGASSDFPLVPPYPLIGVYAAVTRRSEGGNVVVAKEALKPLEALKMYTLSAAAAGFEEKIKGSVQVGKVADFVVLSDDPLRVDAAGIKDLEVEMTILGGKIVYTRGSRSMGDP